MSAPSPSRRLRTGMMLSALVGDLLDELPEDAFAGEDQVEVLFEMLVGTIIAGRRGGGLALRCMPRPRCSAR